MTTLCIYSISYDLNHYVSVTLSLLWVTERLVFHIINTSRLPSMKPLHHFKACFSVQPSYTKPIQTTVQATHEQWQTSLYLLGDLDHHRWSVDWPGSYFTSEQTGIHTDVRHSNKSKLKCRYALKAYTVSQSVSHYQSLHELFGWDSIENNTVKSNGFVDKCSFWESGTSESNLCFHFFSFNFNFRLSLYKGKGTKI